MCSTFIAQLSGGSQSHFENVNQLIAKAKSAMIKNKTRQAKLIVKIISCPPHPVITR